jgi:precorrin-6Y C5,15-methyltransferase (decarboxylating)
LFLCRHGLQELIVSVGENLSYEQEKITTDAAWILAGKEFAELSVMLIRNPRPFCPYRTPGLPDELFARGSVPYGQDGSQNDALGQTASLEPAILFMTIGSGTGFGGN